MILLDTDTDRPLLDSVCNKGLQSRSTPKKMSKSSTKSQEDQNKHSNEDKSSRSPQTEPKPPLTAYSWFMKHKRLELLRENPEISASEIMQKIAQMWKNIDPSQQQLYESLAARDYIRWRKELAEFLEHHPERFRTKSTPQRTPKKTKRKSTVSGWMLYANEMRAKMKEEKADLSFAEMSKKIGDIWNKLPEDIKNQYKEKAKMRQELERGSSEATNVTTTVSVSTTATTTAVATTPSTPEATTDPTKKRKNAEDAQESAPKRQKTETEKGKTETKEEKEMFKEKETPKKIEPEKERSKEHKHKHKHKKKEKEKQKEKKKHKHHHEEHHHEEHHQDRKSVV